MSLVGGHHGPPDVSPDVSTWDRQAGLRAAGAVVANFARVRLPASLQAAYAAAITSFRWA